MYDYNFIFIQYKLTLSPILFDHLFFFEKVVLLHKCVTAIISYFFFFVFLMANTFMKIHLSKLWTLNTSRTGNSYFLIPLSVILPSGMWCKVFFYNNNFVEQISKDRYGEGKRIVNFSHRGRGNKDERNRGVCVCVCEGWNERVLKNRTFRDRHNIIRICRRCRWKLIWSICIREM